MSVLAVLSLLLAACGANQSDVDALEARVLALEQQAGEDGGTSASARVLQESGQAGEAQDEQEAIADQLPIVEAELGAIAGRVPGEMLDFSYFTAPFMAEAIYAERGAAGLSDLLGRPPTTTEQILFPDRWLADEDRVSQERPVLPTDAQLVDEGRIGVAVLGWMLDTTLEPAEADELLREWTGDRWARYEVDGESCLAAIAEFDSVAAAEQVADALTQLHGSTAMVVGEPRFTFDTCAVA